MNKKHMAKLEKILVFHLTDSDLQPFQDIETIYILLTKNP